MDTLDEAIEFVNSREKPLALYVFTESKSILDKVNKFTSAGGVCHNDTVMHVAGEWDHSHCGYSGTSE